MITKVYKYGARTPTEGFEALRGQIRLAIRYRRRLLELERLLWENLRACEAEYYPDIAAQRDEVERLDAEIDTRRPVTPEERAECKELQKQRKKVAAVLSGMRAEVRKEHKPAEDELKKRMEAWLTAHNRKDPPGKGLARAAAVEEMLEEDEWPVYWRARQRIEYDHRQVARDARASSLLHHGTYTAVEDAVERATQDARKIGQAPRGGWIETVKVGTQCQGGKTANKLEIRPLAPAPAGEGLNQRRKRSRTVARVRIGSNHDGSPLWCELPIILHRPLPDGGRVLWAYIVQRRVGYKIQWELQVTVQCEGGRAAAKRRDAVAVSIGWMDRPGGSVLAACWQGSDGSDGEIFVDAVVGERLNQAHSLHGIAERKFEEARAIFCSIRHTLSKDEQEYAEHAPQWRSHRKLQAAIRRAIGDVWLESWRKWRKERLTAGLDLMPTMAEAKAWWPAAPEHWYLYCWTKKDEHLTQWEREVHRSALLRRLEGFRVEAASLAARYQTLVLTGAGETKSGLADLRQFARQDRPMRDQNKGVRKAEHEDRAKRVRVAPGELRQALLLAFCGEVIPVPGEQDRTCSQARARSLLAGWRKLTGKTKSKPARVASVPTASATV